MFSDTQTIGTGLLGLGLLFVFLGCMLLFDRTRLTIGPSDALCGSWPRARVRN